MRLIEASRERSRVVAAAARRRVYNATGFDPDFLERERIADGRVVPMRDDLKNHFAATLAKVHGRAVHRRDRPRGRVVGVFEHAGVDVTVNPRQITAEEIVRLRPRPAHAAGRDARGDRFEVLDITTRRGASTSG